MINQNGNTKWNQRFKCKSFTNYGQSVTKNYCSLQINSCKVCCAPRQAKSIMYSCLKNLVGTPDYKYFGHSDPKLLWHNGSNFYSLYGCIQFKISLMNMLIIKALAVVARMSCCFQPAMLGVARNPRWWCQRLVNY